MNLFGQLVVLFGRVISPTQGLYLHRTTQDRKARTHPCLKWDSKPRSQCSGGRRLRAPDCAAIGTDVLWYIKENNFGMQRDWFGKHGFLFPMTCLYLKLINTIQCAKSERTPSTYFHFLTLRCCQEEQCWILCLALPEVLFHPCVRNQSVILWIQSGPNYKAGNLWPTVLHSLI
jgi:hypothetical protein